MNVLDDLGKGNTVYRAQFETVTKENIGLKQRIENLERENRALKRSVFELTNKLSRLEWEVSKAFQHEAQMSSTQTDLEESYSLRLERQGTGEGYLGSSADSKPLVTDYDGREGPLSLSNLESSGHEIDVSLDGSGRKAEFCCESELKEHTGAVYCVKWSKCAKFLASGSLDKTIQVWNIVDHDAKSSVSFAGHSMLVSTIAWANDKTLVSGSFDQTVKLWKLDAQEQAQVEATFETSGFVQSVETDSNRPEIVYCGTSHGLINLIDKRSTGIQVSVQINGKVHALHTPGLNPHCLYSGDSKGRIKTWDIRKLRESLEAFEKRNDEAGRPITHIASCGEFLSVNSYDDVLRVYTQDSLLKAVTSDKAREGSELRKNLDLVHSFQGHRNKNWPIKSSFFFGRHSDDVSSLPPGRRNSVSDNYRLLATGSSQNVCHVFDLADPSKASKKLRGHQGRVYSCDFNPKGVSPILATASADCKVRLWQLK